MQSCQPSPKLTHFALFAEDMDKMQNFYTKVLGLTVTDQGPFPDPNVPVDMIFMSNDPGEHHQFVLVSGRPEDVAFALNQQMSFLVEDLDELRMIRDRAINAETDNIRIHTHGNAWSIYFRDPEDNQIEVYVHTPWYIPQPHGVPFDLDQSNDEIYRWTEDHCRADAGFMTAPDRKTKMAEMMTSGS